MKAPSAPAPTDPKVSSAADQQAQTGTAIAQTWMNNPQRTNPYGTQTFTRTGTQYTTDAQGKQIEVPTFDENITFSDAEQKNYDYQNQLNWQMSQMGLDQLGRVNDTLSTPVNAEGLPEVDRSLLNKDYEGYREQALNTYRQYMNPELDRQSEANYTRLANQGVREGSEAYREAQALENRGRNDANLQMIMGAGTEMDRAYGQNSQTFQMQDTSRERALQERLALRNQPLNEISALTSGTQVNSPQFSQYQAGNIKPTDVAGQYNHYDQMRMEAYKAESAASSARMSGLFGLGSSLIGGAFRMSDQRLKSDITHLSDDPRGFGWYGYRIGGRAEIGVLAQEVQRIIPHAVAVHPSGFLMVNYGAL